RLRNDEREFRGIWGESSQAAITVKAPTFEEALESQDQIAEIAWKAGIPGFKSLSSIWPSLRTRRRNAAAWDAFWTDKRIALLKREFRGIGGKYSFSNEAFAPFFDNLRKHDFSASFADSSGFALFRGKFGKIGAKETRLDAFFDDTPANVAKVRRLLASIPNVSVISPKRFGEYISESILNDARIVALFALPLILLLAWICLRDPRNVALAMVPVITAIALEFPAHAIAGLKLNAIGLVAMIVVTGLAVDYGIFAVSAADRGDARFAENAVASLTISMLTTAIGSGALLFASHPALRTVGLVVTVGVIAAWASAIFAVPALRSRP
ncbi:MAG: MMPL family transporter, partial [Kiritimatiellaeota bacterium]|nr:MMPL family transporter [Kiritimatiellota bacterium]